MCRALGDITSILGPSRLFESVAQGGGALLERASSRRRMRDMHTTRRCAACSSALSPASHACPRLTHPAFSHLGSCARVQACQLRSGVPRYPALPSAQRHCHGAQPAREYALARLRPRSPPKALCRYSHASACLFARRSLTCLTNCVRLSLVMAGRLSTNGRAVTSCWTYTAYASMTTRLHSARANHCESYPPTLLERPLEGLVSSTSNGVYTST